MDRESKIPIYKNKEIISIITVVNYINNKLNQDVRNPKFYSHTTLHFLNTECKVNFYINKYLFLKLN